MNGSIICGVDGSPGAQEALRVAAQLSGQLGSRLVVAHVTRRQVSGPDPAPPGIAPEEAEIAAAEHLVEELVLAEGLVDAKRCVALGLPAEGLADLADDEGAGLIVVGSRGRGAFKAAFLGSVSNELIGVARCPVVVVPQGATGVQAA
jgi:nucleotide-binding universal stress UspA family protein